MLDHLRRTTNEEGSTHTDEKSTLTWLKDLNHSEEKEDRSDSCRPLSPDVSFSLVPRPPLFFFLFIGFHSVSGLPRFFVLWFSFSIIHGL